MTNQVTRVIKLTAPQVRALSKLTNEWQSAYTLRESMNVLNALVNKELAIKSYGRGYSFPGFAATSIKYKLKEIKI